MAWRLASERGSNIQAPGFDDAFLIDGKPPKLGETLKPGRLADTFEQLGKAGLDDFYRGDIGREIADDLEKIGSPVTRADIEKFRAVLREPLAVKLNSGDGLYLARADAGNHHASDARHLREARTGEGRELRVPAWADRGGEARHENPHAGRHRF